jgi:hypothetical protein
MGVDELYWFVRDGRRAVVHLQMNCPEVVVRVVLVPADQQTSVWLAPAEPIVLVWLLSLQLKSDLNPRGRHWILVVIKELAWVYLSNDSVRAGFAGFSTSSMNILERAAESILDPVVEPLALQVCLVSEEDNH